MYYYNPDPYGQQPELTLTEPTHNSGYKAALAFIIILCIGIISICVTVCIGSVKKYIQFN